MASNQHSSPMEEAVHHVALEVGAPMPTSEQASGTMLQAVHYKRRVTLEFNQVSAFVPVLVIPVASSTSDETDNKLEGAKAPTEKQVLHGISGVVKPGEVLALMGPSGSGKSSLLAILGGRSTATTTGNILFNGNPLDKPMKRKLGYVAQDDLLYAELTVYETMYFTALLRLPRTWSREFKLARVEMVLAGLGLSKCRDTIIGNYSMRGVSGGERKRVSIGCELLINPSAIFLDEPTSGLDSTTALSLMHTLRALATGGRGIITSIHQPSTRLYMQMDKLMLLSDGHCMYYGDAHAAAHWFGIQGQPLPFGASIVDHMLDLASGDLPGHRSEDSGAIKQHLISAFEKRSCGLGEDGITAMDVGAVEVVTGTVHEEHVSAALAGTAPSTACTAASACTAAQSTGEEQEDKWGANWFVQCQLLISRSMRLRRFTSLSLQRFAEYVVTACLAGLFWWQLGRRMDVPGAQDVGGLLFFELVFTSISAVFQSIFAFPLEFNMMVKERQSGMYRLSAYYAAKTFADLPMDCMAPSLFIWILYWMAGLRITAGAFIGHWWAIILGMLVGQSIGMLIGATITNLKTCLAVASITILVIMLVGGFYVRSIPVWICWLKYSSFIYWGYNLLLKIQFAGLRIQADCGDQVGSCYVSDTNAFSIDVDASAAREVCILFAMLIVLRACIYWALKRKTSFNK